MKHGHKHVRIFAFNQSQRLFQMKLVHTLIYIRMHSLWMSLNVEQLR